MRSHTQLLKDGFDIFKQNVKLFLYIFIIPALLSVMVGLILESIENKSEFLSAISVLPIAVLVLIIANLLMAIAMIKAVSAPTETTFQNAYSFAFKHLLSYVWVSVLVGVATVIGLVLFVIPGIIFAVWFSFSYFTLLFENIHGVEALRASKAYVKGRWMAIFGRMVFLLFITIVLSLALGFIFGINAETRNEIIPLIATQALNFVLIPVSIAYMYLLYQDVRNVRTVTAEVPHEEPPRENIQS